MPKADLSFAIGLKPEEAIKYFKSKGYTFSWDWHDTWQEAHAKAFTVAKVTRLDILKDIRGMLDEALEEGITFQQFKSELEPRLKAKGWWGYKFVGRPDGTIEKILEGSPWRLKTIFQTNLQSSYMAGRYKNFIENVDNRGYFRYVAVLDSRTRPHHRAFHNKVFRHDDPFWNHFWPPWEWNCRCDVEALSPDEVEREGLKIESAEGKLSEEDRLVSSKTGEFRPVTVYEDPEIGVIATGIGWDYNQGKTAIFLDILAYQKLQDLPSEVQTLFINEMASSDIYEKAFPSWVDGVLKDPQPRGQSIAIGWMDNNVLKYLERENFQPETPVIGATSRGIKHIENKIRTGEISLQEIRNIPQFIRNPEVILYDSDDPALLYVISTDDKKLKSVVRINRPIKRERINWIATTSKVSTRDLKHSRYKIIKGEIK